MKKIILTICCILLSWSTQADEVKLKRCGKSCGYTLSEGVLTVKPIKADKEASIRKEAFANNKDIKEVIIDEGITSIGEKYVIKKMSRLWNRS